MTPDDLGERLSGHPALRDVSLLVLHGSRARGDAGPDADWDLGVLTATGSSPDLPAVATALVRMLGTERVDVVDLGTASALLRFRASRDGVALVEREAGGFLRFRQEAVRFWCDAGPVIRAAQDDVLARLG
ncbi:nucleotidyltransferase domain-containing protein [Pseudonocardia sp. KRD291]|uniref:type VII toxin-antitoxin system MntA family adenylyltransferase antitoxin n=1 Tax=Pseudonocardia sp. KRD291 TaxID=2792007 RepID=UPI001C4A176E|nr:nucleotidyltransferase domain-containing protein [Pseudonocardia sp. KRD291]MBW0102111.1 nucleotidyltransferase domain-containing protein [Pseudonocardia sp. KRD291]